MGWFFGFKLHLICNEKGELLNFMITPGDVDDRKPLEYKSFCGFYIWQAGRRQGVHQQESLPKAVRGWNTTYYQAEKQHERSFDERF